MQAARKTEYMSDYGNSTFRTVFLILSIKFVNILCASGLTDVLQPIFCIKDGKNVIVDHDKRWKFILNISKVAIKVKIDRMMNDGIAVVWVCG